MASSARANGSLVWRGVRTLGRRRRSLPRTFGRAVASGRFPVEDVATSVASVSGATWAVIRARLAGAASPDAGRLLAEGALRLLGLRAADARRAVASVVALRLTEAI